MSEKKKKFKNCYISNCAVVNLNIYHNLLTYGYVNPSDYNIPLQRFQRYIANIRFMLSDYFVYNINVEYDNINHRYVLVK